MAFNFEDLSPEAKRAAFAHMDAAGKARSKAKGTVTSAGKTSGAAPKSGTKSATKSVSLGRAATKQPATPQETQVSHPKLYHVTRPESAAAIKREGFHGKVRSEDEGGLAFFGAGTYLHTNKSHSNRYLADVRDSEYGDEVQIPTSAHVSNPFTIQVRPDEQQANPDSVMHRALQEAGIVGPEEKKFLTPNEITSRLKKHGYDGVHVKQKDYSEDITGDQLVVFNPKAAQYGHQEPPTQGKTSTTGAASRMSKPKTAAHKMVQASGVTSIDKELARLKADIRASLASPALTESERAKLDAFVTKAKARAATLPDDRYTAAAKKDAETKKALQAKGSASKKLSNARAARSK